MPTKSSRRSSPRLRAYAHVLSARTVERLRNRPPLPHASHVLITWRCNLRCNGCDAWQRKPEGELNAEQWQQVFRQLRFLDIIKIIGGEPFTREDLPEIITNIRNDINPFVLQLVTNGALPDQITKFAEQHAWPNLHLRVSLDGLADTHDASRGQPGAFDKVMETLERLSEVRKRKKFNLGVNFTMTDESVNELDELSALCAKIGVDVVPGFKVKPFLRDCDIRKERAATIGLQDRSGAVAHLDKTRHGASSGFNTSEKLLLRLFNSIVFRKHAAGGDAVKFCCGELRHLMYLNPSGELITCGLNQKPLGNVLEDGFHNIWNSQKLVSPRQEVKECPGCMQGAVEIMSRLYE